MIKITIPALLFFMFTGHCCYSQNETRLRYQSQFPDSIISFYNELAVPKGNDKHTGKYIACGFADGYLGLRINAGKERSVVFSVRHNTNSNLSTRGSSKTLAVASGENILRENEHAFAWPFDWKADSNYRFLVRVATDSVSNTTTYSAYFFAPEHKAWKFMATARTTMNITYLHMPYAALEMKGKKIIKAHFHNAWQRSESGKWDELYNATIPCTQRNHAAENRGSTFILKTGVFNGAAGCKFAVTADSTGKKPTAAVSKNIDSVAQANKDRQLMIKALSGGVIDTTGSIGSVWYKILKEGSGAYINSTDTLTVFYKGWVLNGPVFDSTDTKPAVFPLVRLIKGFQLAMPMAKVGGKIRMILPSALAYGPVNVAYDLPPNSVLVFDVEVMKAVKQEEEISR